MNNVDIKRMISQELVKKIFGNQKNAMDFLALLGVQTKVKNAKEAYNLIVEHWDYQQAYQIIRQLFKQTDKYKKGLSGENNIAVLLQEWNQLGLGNIEWPFSQGQFDSFVQKINSSSEARTNKDQKVKDAAIRYRRIKEINTERNDYLETLIFLNNENVIPTLYHSRGLDFFINGVSFDQKVARSPTNEFKKEFGEKWKDIAIQYPEKVAEYLYTYQDEGRFGAEPRLFIVYLDENIEPIKIRQAIEENKLENPYKIKFKYKHKSTGEKAYQTEAFVILLTNDYA
ncbi:hypothetical protein PTQ27_08555 [Mannheimia sp. AT1]|uniref:Uncharacterized protein n=1 Tax=Mannheimia cairinae TaxID=3025936 RepID=A0ABT5MUH0_9PAST|nr:hypothetical protein [Mannheimia cairinae]MDD0824513.1 hypothetical protein [Mannheimia cairinae]MDD0825614.1 hypothetical protein [Mannheimia cairinae]